MDKDNLLELDAKHLIHPNYPVGKHAEIVIECGEGPWLYDIDGKRYFDGRSQLSCVNLGYSHPQLVEAIQAQSARLSYLSVFYQFTHPLAAECAARIARLLPGDLDRVFFSSGGSEAVELALNLARLYWSRVKPSKRKVISRLLGYHGNTAGAVSATGIPIGGFPALTLLVPDHILIDAPYQFRDAPELSPNDYSQKLADQLDSAIQSHGHDSIGAFIGEPIMGVGGVLVPPDNYWSLVREICSHYDILLIVDEVITGFFRTGAAFASNFYGIVPDIIVMGKGINSSYVPCGAVGFGARIRDAIEGTSLTGFTNSAHPLAMAATSAALDVYEDAGFRCQLEALTAHVRRRMETELAQLPVVGCVEGKGMLLGIDLVSDQDSRGPLPSDVAARVVARSLDRGMLTRIKGRRVSYYPPLNISIEEADHSLDILYSVLNGLLEE